MRAVSYLEMLFYFIFLKYFRFNRHLGSCYNSFKEKVGGRHSDQGSFDNTNLLTLNPYTGDRMKDLAEAQMGRRG